MRIKVIPISSIKSVVSMFPDLKVTPEGGACRHSKVCVVKAPRSSQLAKYNTEGLFDEEDDDDTDPIIE